ncbi:endodeoxyribonuclease [Bacillus wiedmannii]|uniref:HNH endonuclease n=1 Tax=Bacillus wiedmannii TaxID=1890302 RepID=UPI000BFBCE6E|nr:HNH endonuclease [Bacillus wiedmannii]PHE75181.1 endodeoxyribonuclease [Bacillus wiedmannii]
MMIKDIEGYEGLYEITEDGRVFRKERTVKTTKKNGQIYNQKLKRLELKQQVIKCGYLSVHLFKNGKVKFIQIHRLVAQTFIPNLGNKPQVNHINGIKTDNCVSNLEWVTRSENLKHAFANELLIAKRGTEHTLSKLNDNDIREIRKMSANGISKMQISKEFNVSRSLISHIVSRKRWKHVE